MQAGCKGNTGAAQPTGGFGQATTPSVFGTPQASSPFGGTAPTVFGQASAPGFGLSAPQSSASIFGASSMPSFSGLGGASTGFGAASGVSHTILLNGVAAARPCEPC